MEELFSRALSLPAPQQRRVAAILGAVVADAAAQPIHWVYSSDKMSEILSGREDRPEFVSPSQNPFYRLPTGSQSMYGDLLIATLESLVEQGGFRAEPCAAGLQSSFGPGSAYDDTTSSSYTKGMDVTQKSLPVDGKWRTFCIRRFLECHSAGKVVEDLTEEDTNKDPDNIIRLVPLVALLAGRRELLPTLEEAALQLQTSDLSLAVVLAAARLLEQFILEEGAEPVRQAVEALKRGAPLDRAMAGHLQAVLDAQEKTVAEATLEFGLA